MKNDIAVHHISVSLLKRFERLHHFYSIFQGEKVFYLVRPTQANLMLYEKWLSSKNQSEKFFGDQVSCLARSTMVYLRSDLPLIILSSSVCLFIKNPAGLVDGHGLRPDLEKVRKCPQSDFLEECGFILYKVACFKEFVEFLKRNN